MSGRTGNDTQHRSPLKSVILIHIAALVASLSLAFLLTTLLLEQAWFNRFLISNDLNETTLAVIVVAAVCLNNYLVFVAQRRTGSNSNTISSMPRKKTKTVQRGLVVRTDNLDSSERARALRLVKLKRTTERLNTVERELIRKLGTYYTDRETGQLMCELQICTNRVLAQVAEMRHVSHSKLEHSEVV